MMQSLLTKLLLTACFLIFILPTSRAQKHCDLALQIISPAQGAEIPYGDTLKMYISVKNLGPDDIDSSDAFFYIMNGLPFPMYFDNNSIPAGDSLVYMPFLTVSGENDTDYHLSLCSYLLVDSNTFQDDNPTNDSACMNVVLKAKNHTGISTASQNKLSAQLYPNPATSFIDFSVDESGRYEVRITNILGRQCLSKEFEGKHCRLNLNSLAEGIYQYRLMNKRNGQSTFGKFLKE